MTAYRCMVALLAAISIAQPVEAGTATLDDARAAVRADFPSVQSVSPDALEKMRAAGADILLLDTRSEREFAVSRIPGAVRADPKLSAPEFLAAFGDAARGKTVVFYCSVGARSSALADRVTSGLSESGAKAVRSLDGGVFAWSLEGRPLENDDGPTRKVDGYDASWGKLLAPPSGAPPR